MNEKEWDKLLTRVSKQLYEGKMKPGSISPEMVKTIAGELMAGINIGYGKSFADEGLTNTQFQTLQTLEKNVFHFSGAKNWHQLREMSQLLTDKAGNLKPFSQFLSEVRTVDTTYNKHYLEAEYENAVTSAQMIDKWQQFEAEKDALPFLIWQTERSDRVCPLCEGLHGLKLRVDNPFWKTHGIPRHFRCHCDFIQDDTGPEEDWTKRKIPEVHPMFRSNPGITGVAFTDKHPYFETIPEKAKKNIFIAVEKIIPHHSKERSIMNRKKYNSYPKDYERVDFDKASGGYIVKHRLHGKTKAHENAAYDYLKENGYGVELPPKPAKGKHPDSVIDGIMRELKSFLSSGNLQNAVSTAVNDKVKQSGNLLFHISQTFSYEDVLNGLRGGFAKNEKAKSVLVIFGQSKKAKHRIFSRTQIMKKYFVIKTLKELRADKP